MSRKQDNSTYREKVALRRLMLRQMAAEAQVPVIIETHGRLGAIWAAVYASVREGAVFEKAEDRATCLATQRPTWAVYEGDCVNALRAGAGAHLAANVLDVDSYGEPWPAIEAFFDSSRPRATQFWVIVNDGLRHKVRLKGAWTANSLAHIVQQFGVDLHSRYLEVCKYLIAEKAALAGYRLHRFAGYYCGCYHSMTHYLALLSR